MKLRSEIDGAIERRYQPMADCLGITPSELMEKILAHLGENDCRILLEELAVKEVFFDAESAALTAWKFQQLSPGIYARPVKKGIRWQIETLLAEEEEE